ncbi:MAG: hypothetical protein IKT47_09630 [Oscillospiraceae bacterium]|nr:hypothetical protein [Oscillospiraceae bacterium]
MIRVVALVLALACILGAGCAKIVEQDENKPAVPSEFSVAQAVYPEMVPYPDEMDDKAYTAWKESKQAQRNQYEGYREGLDAFFTASIREYLSGAEGANRAYSPLNVFMALAMLAEITDGESRGQILELMGKTDIDELRQQAKAIWNANYSADGALTSVMAGSVWLNEDVNFVQETMDSLATNYYASSFRGTMGSPEFNKALQDWLNEQTGGLLEEQAEGVELSAETILALATTVYFRGKWANEFNKNATTQEQFYLLDDEAQSVTVDFMHKSGTNTYYWGDKFSSVSLRFEGGCSMQLILPDEGVSVDELLADDEAMRFMLSREGWDNSKYLIVNMSVPKFDVVSDIDLADGLKEMGITDVFDPAVSDFTPMTTDMDGIAVSAAKHAARVTVDEEGCTAAAYTVMMAAGDAMPPDEEVDFILNRPFVFVLTSMDGLPLFTGVVNNPA